MLRKKFESRAWRKDESFHEYVHEKVIMGNCVPIDQDELVEQVVDDILDTMLRDQARLQRFLTTAFERIRGNNSAECTRGVPGHGRRDEQSGGAVKNEQSRRFDGAMRSNDKERDNRDRRCFIYNSRRHVSAICPTKELGTKYFECGGYGHIASKCPKKGVVPKEAVVASISRKKCVKEITVNFQMIVALVDTGSGISIMQANML